MTITKISDREIAIQKELSLANKLAQLNGEICIDTKAERNTLRKQLAEAHAEIKRLQLEVSNRNRRALEGDKVKVAFNQLCMEQDTLRQQLAEAQRDAKRYRWLRQAISQHARVMPLTDGIDELVVWHTAEDVDTSIDAA